MTGPPPSGRPVRRWSGRTRGQATVELALGFPLVLVGILLVLQLVVVGRDQLLVSHAAREAARAAAVDADGGAARRGAEHSTTALDPARLDVSAHRSGDHVEVTVRYRSRTVLPLVGPLVPDPDLSGRVTMRIEHDG